MRVLHDKWVSVTTARRGEARSEVADEWTVSNMESSWEYVEYAVADNRKVVVLHLGRWARCWIDHVMNHSQLSPSWTDPLVQPKQLKRDQERDRRRTVVNEVMNFWVPQNAGISWIAENLLASEEKLCFMEFLNEVRNTNNAGHAATYMISFTSVWPCIATNFFVIKPTDALISKFIFVKKLYMFRAVPLPIIRSFPLYIWHWYRSCRADDSFQARPGWNCSSILVVLESCLQTCMTYTSAECTVENS